MGGGAGWGGLPTRDTPLSGLTTGGWGGPVFQFSGALRLPARRSAFLTYFLYVAPDRAITKKRAAPHWAGLGRCSEIGPLVGGNSKRKLHPFSDGRRHVETNLNSSGRGRGKLRRWARASLFLFWYEKAACANDLMFRGEILSEVCAVGAPDSRFNWVAVGGF